MEALSPRHCSYCGRRHELSGLKGFAVNEYPLMIALAIECGCGATDVVFLRMKDLFESYPDIFNSDCESTDEDRKRFLEELNRYGLGE